MRSPLLVACAVAVICWTAACSQSVPAPVQYVASKADEYTATPNPANDDPNLDPPFGPFDVQTVFWIDKSNDMDRVDYGMRLDQHCAPASDDAVFPYWRQMDKVPVRSHELSFLHLLAFGISKQRVLRKERTGGQHGLRLKQVDRPILIVTRRGKDGMCAATAYTTIDGVKDARLDRIFVKVTSKTSADYADVFGTHPKTNASLMERVTP